MAKKTKAEAARENGKKGGRPKKELDLSAFEHCGEPPIGKPLELARWVQGVLAVDMFRMICGKADRLLSGDLRNTGRAIVQSLPPDIIAEAQRIMTAEAGELDAEAGPSTVSAGGVDGQSKPTRSISG